MRSFRILQSIVMRPENRTHSDYIEVQFRVRGSGDEGLSESTVYVTLDSQATHDLYRQLGIEAGLVYPEDDRRT